ncbi:MAG: sigma-54 dependent transcriptional regulator [Planctomycetota bacterium]
MTESSSNVLIIDDEESICWGLSRLCEQLSLGSAIASSAEAGLKLAGEERFDLIIMDVRLPGIDGLSAIKLFHEKLGPVPVITITAFGDLQTAITSVQNGAFEYIVKPFELETVRSRILQALAVSELADSTGSGAGSEPAVSESTSGLIGSSAIMQEVFKQIALTTTTNSPVLITGESGTGKELTARAIHKFSQRSLGPFVAVNIASLNPTLAESELFGHVKGAFTGAETDRIGLIQQASGGTLFLDEVAEIPIEIQVKLLRVLDQGEVTPVGSGQSVKTDFRLLSATHQDLLAQVNHGEFRHDLFYRLRTFEIQLPALREHRQDIPALASHFLNAVSGDRVLTISPDFVAALQNRAWPGNVRELRNVVERAAIVARGGVLTADHIDDIQVELPTQSSSSNDANLEQLAADWVRSNWDSEGPLYERFLQMIEPSIMKTAFELSDRQYSAAARKLGIHRTTIKKKLDEAHEKSEGGES